MTGMTTESRSPPRSEATTLTVKLVLLATTTALVLLVTTFATTPLPGTPGQRFNAGDIMVFVTSLTFGPSVGGFAGGVGSSLSDALLPGGQYFAPFTLIIKGAEGYLVGYVASRSIRRREQIAWFVGGAAVVGGYFVAETLLIGVFFGATVAPGLANAIIELPFNVLQALAAGVVGIPLSRYLKRSLPQVLVPSLGKGPGVSEKPS